jgi:hypothetical protein
MKAQQTKHFRVDEQGILWLNDCLIIPKDRELKNQIMDEAHLSRLSIHPGNNKIYHDLRPCFWWTKMKEIAAYVARCDTCCRAKAIHMKLASLLQLLSVPKWISLQDFPPLRKEMIPFGWLLIISPNQHTLFRLRRTIDHPSMLICIFLKLFDCMVFQKSLYLIEGYSLLLTFGNTYIKVWVLV